MTDDEFFESKNTIVWEPFEGWDTSSLVDHISEQADNYISFANTAFDLVTK